MRLQRCSVPKVAQRSYAMLVYRTHFLSGFGCHFKTFDFSRDLTDGSSLEELSAIQSGSLSYIQTCNGQPASLPGQFKRVAMFPYLVLISIAEKPRIH